MNRIVQVLAIGTGASFLAFSFAWYYPLLSVFVYFGAGVLARIVMVEHSLLSGLVVSLPGVLLVTCLVFEGEGPILSAEVAVWYSFIPVAIAGSLFGVRIARRFGKQI